MRISRDSSFILLIMPWGLLSYFPGWLTPHSLSGKPHEIGSHCSQDPGEEGRGRGRQKHASTAAGASWEQGPRPGSHRGSLLWGHQGIEGQRGHQDGAVFFSSLALNPGA